MSQKNTQTGIQSQFPRGTSPPPYKSSPGNFGRPTIETLDKEIARLTRRETYRGLFLSFIVTATVLFIMLGVVFGIAIVNGNSMFPEIKEGDIALFSRFGSPQAGDIVLLHTEEDEYIKRIFGMPGDVIAIDDNGNVFISGISAAANLNPGNSLCNISYPLLLAPDEYFVLGDNMYNSTDSRNYGPVKGSQIRGKVITVLRTRHISQ